VATVLAAEGSRSGGGGVSRPGRAVVEVSGRLTVRRMGWGLALRSGRAVWVWLLGR